MDRADQHLGLRVGQSFALRCSAALPGPKVAQACRQLITQHAKRK